jgi:SAM-dependent methyltransferase
MTEFDPDQVRADMRDHWESAAPHWDDRIDQFYEASQPVSDWLLGRTAPNPGETVLELAAGRGDLSLASADLVGTEGRVVCTDGAEAMVKIAERRAMGRGLPIETKQMELEWVDAETASFDVVLCRFGFMLCVDPEAALRETRRVLKSGGRLGLAVWATPSENPWLEAPHAEAIKAGHIERPDPATPGAFKLSAPGALEEVLASAGFVVGELEAVDITVSQPSLDAFWEAMLELSESMRQVVAALSPADHYRFRDAVEARWSPHVQSDGSVAVPGRALCALVEA